MTKHHIPNLISDLLEEWRGKCQQVSNVRVNMPDMETNDMRIAYRKFSEYFAKEVEKTLFDYTEEECRAHPKWTGPKPTLQTENEAFDVIVKFLKES
jgi:hypothetical protein